MRVWVRVRACAFAVGGTLALSLARRAKAASRRLVELHESDAAGRGQGRWGLLQLLLTPFRSWDRV